MRPVTGHIVIAFALLLLTVGCVGGAPDPDATPEPTTASPTDTPAPGGTTPTTDTPSPTEATHTTDRHQAATNQSHAGKEVRIENAWNDSATVRVRVIRNATGETVHDGTYTVSPDERLTVYNVSDASPDGIESFTAVVTARNETRRVTIETNRCYGNVYGELLEDGELYVYYEIC